MDSLADRLSRIVVVGNDDDIAAVSEAATYFRQHATVLEIGRGVGREEAAKVCEVSSDAAVEEAATSLASGDTKGRLTMITHHLCANGLAAAIRAASPARDVEGMVERLAWTIHTAGGYDLDPDDWLHLSPETKSKRRTQARAVLASLGIKNG